MRKGFCTVFLICALSCPAIAQQQPSTAVAVGVVKAERKPVAQAGDYVGGVEAISRVERLVAARFLRFAIWCLLFGHAL
jgi:hypothetical protein